MCIRIVLILLFTFVPVSVFACAPDSLRVERDADSCRDYKFRYAQLILPASLVAVGGVGVSCFPGVKAALRDGALDISSGRRTDADDYLQYLPLATYLTLGFTGLPHRSSFKERMLVAATSYLAMGVAVKLTKLAVRERRPLSSYRDAFPSGHTARAFLGAELIRIEYGAIAASAAYVVATGVGLMRMCNDRHWYNDVLAGAGIGILSASLGYWLLPLERRLFGLENSSTTCVLLPSISSASGVGMAMVVAF